MKMVVNIAKNFADPIQSHGFLNDMKIKFWILDIDHNGFNLYIEVRVKNIWR